MKRIIVIFVACLSLIVSACSVVQDVRVQPEQTLEAVEPVEDVGGAYISFTTTSYDNRKGPEGGMTSHVFCYDIDKDEVTEVTAFGYNSQYPLGVYSKRDNAVYYTAKNKMDSRRGDDVFMYDVSTGENKQLTNAFFAINYIAPRKDDILIVGVKAKTRALRLVRYIRETGELIFDNLDDDDTNVEKFTLDSNDENIYYTVTISEDERMLEGENAFKENRPQEEHSFLNRYTGGFDTKEQFYDFKEYVYDLSATGDKVYLCHSKPLYNDYKYSLINPDTAEIVPCEVKLGNLSPDGKGIFGIHTEEKSGERYVYYMDLKTLEKKKIYVQEKGVEWINNIMLVPNTP